MTVALATLESNVYTTLYSFLTSGTYSLITEGTISNANQVTPVYSDNASNLYGFPIIELGDPTIISIDDSRFGRFFNAQVSVPFLVVEDNASDAKSSADVVKYKLMSGYGTLKSDGLYKPRGRQFIVNVGKTVISLNKKHYHYKRFSVNFDYKERL